MKDIRTVPSDGLKGLKENWKSDILSGFVVFLIALPLSLGIAMASGVPPMAGIISAFIGGMVISLFSGSYVTINGPAAGLIVIVLTSVEKLGDGDLAVGYPYFLAATVISGFFLILMGLAKAGKLGDFFPLSVVHGMLAAIGIIIMSKQIHIVLGVKPSSKNPLDLLAEIPYSIMNMHPEIALIGLLCLVIMIFLVFFVKNKNIKKIPAPLIAVIVGMILAAIFQLDNPHDDTIFGSKFHLGPEYLVNLPDNFLGGFTFPNFGKIGTIDFWTVVMTVTLIQGLESMLSASAVEQLDPYKRHTNLNKDVVAVGIGSVVSGALGGIPIIAEIVRSSANISNGAKTRWSNFFHGVFVFLSVLLIPEIIHMIPLACLASLLVITGFRLASPKEFIHMYHLGKGQLIVFVGTMIGILATDLLKGIFIGLGIKLLMNIYYGAKINELFKVKFHIERDSKDNDCEVILEDSITFSNYLFLKEKLMQVPIEKNLKINFCNVTYIDHTALEHLIRMRMDRNIQEKSLTSFVGLELLKPLSHHHLAARVKSDVELVSTKNLSSRQLKIAELAEKHNFGFSCTAEPANYHLKKFNLFAITRISHEMNFLHGILGEGETDFHISDIVIFDRGDIVKSQNNVMTGMLVRHLPYPLPEFVLEREHLIDKLFVKLGYQDIDFEEYPVFSDKYLLAGKDEDKIREFFTSKMIKLFESNPIYYLESKGGMLFIQMKQGVLNVLEIELLLMFAKEFLKLGVKQTEKVS
jgi:MFS superfamily sulfate permease-like transporter